MAAVAFVSSTAGVTFFAAGFGFGAASSVFPSAGSAADAGAAAAGATVFLTTHVLEVVERLCDRVAIINQGRIVTCAALSELRAGGESLEDAFVRLVGAGQQTGRLEWL